MKLLSNNYTVFLKRLLPLIILLFICIVSRGTAYSETISAELVQNKGTSLTIKIHVESPPPASIIVQFSIPSGIKIVNSSPGISKFDAKSNSAKWLLRSITSGTTNISIVTSKRISARDASAIIRYRNRNSGSLVEVRAASN